MVSENGEASRACRPRYWLIVDPVPGGLDVLTIDLAGGEKALAVFSFQEEAELFLRCEPPGTGWRVRETTEGELVSVLRGPCASLGKVVLDPLPRSIGKGMAGLVSLRRDDFVRVLVSEREVSATAAIQRPLQTPIGHAVREGVERG